MKDTASVPYNDRYFRIVLSLIAAHIIVMYNDRQSFFEAVFTFSYLRGMAVSFIIALLLTQYVHYITVRLDRRFDWHGNTLLRLFWQALIAFAAPSLLAFLLAAFFFWVFNINIFHTTYLQQDYTVVVFMILSINMYYFGLNSFLRLRHMPAQPNITKQDILPAEAGEFTIEKKDNGTATATLPKEIIMVDTLTKSIPVKVETIRYCYILRGSIFVRTADMASLNDSYQVPGNLRSLEELLDKRLFFRINRQMIVSFSACKYFKPGKNKTLELTLDPLPYDKGAKIPEEHSRLCIVSEDRATLFKAWMDR